MDSKARARRLIEIIDDWFPFRVDPTAVSVPELVLAGVARCQRLLDGMVQVHSSPDLAGLFARALYETWLSSIYMLLGSDDAYERLEANDSFELRRMAKRLLDLADVNPQFPTHLRKQCDDALQTPESSGKRIDTAALSHEVRRLLQEIGDQNADWPITAYAVVFAPESYTTTHGGLGAIKQYLLDRGEVVPRISGDPWSHGGHDHRLDVMTAAVLVLAFRAGSELNLPVEVLDEFARQWADGPQLSQRHW